MKTYRVVWRRRDIAGGIAPLVAMVWSIALPIVGADAADVIDGFTEPYRTIEIASTEMGIIATIHVREGETVKRGQLLAKLDQDILAAQLAIATKAMQSRGVIESALSELRLRQRPLEKLRQLQAKGHAGESQVARALADFEIAKAQVLSANEQLVIRRLEYEKVRIQIEHRTIRAPTDGVIAAIYKAEGEFVATTEPFIMLVQLDPMLAVFSVTSQQRRSFRRGDKVELQLAISGPKDVKWTSVEGEVEFVSPVAEAESGTVLVKVRIPNPKHVYRTGERCTVLMPVPGARENRTHFTVGIVNAEARSQPGIAHGSQQKPGDAQMQIGRGMDAGDAAVAAQTGGPAGEQRRSAIDSRKTLLWLILMVWVTGVLVMCSFLGKLLGLYVRRVRNE